MRKCTFLSLFWALVLAAVGPAAAGERAGKVVLDTAGYWRCRYARGTDVAVTKDGKQIPVHPSQPREKTREMVDGKRKYVTRLRAHKAARLWGAPPADWAKADFDDSNWPRLRGPFLIGKYKTPQYGYRSVPVFCLRGKFRVASPSGGLKLSVVYLGGIAVYVNGKEITRQHLPKGELKPDTLAEPYPSEAFLDPEGLLLNTKKPDGKLADRYAKRLREIKGLKIPASALRKGINVLALKLHRASAPAIMFTGKGKGWPWNTVPLARGTAWWSRIGIKSVTLAGPAEGSTGRPKGFQVWTAPVYQELRPADYGDPCDSPGRISLCTGRGGVVSGQAVASSDAALSGLKAVASDLTGPGKIPAAAIQLRYARLGCNRWGRPRGIFLELEEFPLETGTVQPVWVTVRVPRDAKPGEYKGKVTLSAAGQKAVDVLIALRVVDWEVPDPKNFENSFLEFIQSPESVALQYKVKMWSEEHWKLLDRTFKLLGEVGNKVVYVTAQHKTHFGNPRSMIRYVKSGSGKYDYKPDFSIVEKYLDLAVKHWGKVPVVGLYIWRSTWETGNFAGAGPRGDRKILITVKDPKTGALSSAEGPAWGTPECAKFWKPVIDGMKKLCADRGIGKSLMMGQSGDYTPTDTALADLDKASGGLLWIHHSHVTRTALGNMGGQPTGPRRWKRGGKDGKTYPVGMVARAWGGDGAHKDPDFGRGYGWKNRIGPWRTVTREVFNDHPLPMLRFRLEAMVTNVIHPPHVGGNKDYGTHGIGRMGADFWTVLTDKRGRKRMLCARYPETAWGQLSINCCGPFFLRPGRDGAIGTAQIEMFRESAQEIEARTVIEKALADEAKKAKLGKELAERAQEVLDNRTRVIQRSAKAGKRPDQRGLMALGIQEHSEQLYKLVAEVAEKLKK